MTVFSVTVDMAFNHDRSVNDGSDGINIRTNANDNTEHHAPEYTQNSININQSTNYGTTDNKTVLYVADKNVTVYNRFVITPIIPSGVTLKLEANASNVSIDGLEETEVTFNANGISTGSKTIAGIAGFVGFNAKSQTSSTVNKETSTFVWNVTNIFNKTQ